MATSLPITVFVLFMCEWDTSLATQKGTLDNVHTPSWNYVPYRWRPPNFQRSKPDGYLVLTLCGIDSRDFSIASVWLGDIRARFYTCSKFFSPCLNPTISLSHSFSVFLSSRSLSFFLPLMVAALTSLEFLRAHWRSVLTLRAVRLRAIRIVLLTETQINIIKGQNRMATGMTCITIPVGMLAILVC